MLKISFVSARMRNMLSCTKSELISRRISFHRPSLDMKKNAVLNRNVEARQRWLLKFLIRHYRLSVIITFKMIELKLRNNRVGSA